MRKLVAAMAFLLFCQAQELKAQFRKGDRMIGTSIASFFYNSGSSTVTFPQYPGYRSKSSGYGVQIQPNIGWFLSESMAVGASLTIHPYGQKVTYENNGTSFQQDKSGNFDLGLGAFARKYFGDGNDFMPYGQAGISSGISMASSEGYRYWDETIDYKTAYTGESSGGFFLNGQLQLGLTKMLGENAGLEIFGGYVYSYNKNTYNTTTTYDYGLDGMIERTDVNEPTTKFTNHNFFLGLGIQVFLRKK